MLLPEPRGLFDDLFGMAGAGGGPTARLAATFGAATGEAIALRALLVSRMAAIPGMDAVVGDAGALVELVSGRPLARMPVRLRVR